MACFGHEIEQNFLFESLLCLSNLPCLLVTLLAHLPGKVYVYGRLYEGVLCVIAIRQTSQGSATKIVQGIDVCPFIKEVS